MSGIVKPNGEVVPVFGSVEPVNFRAEYLPPKSATVESVRLYLDPNFTIEPYQTAFIDALRVTGAMLFGGKEKPVSLLYAISASMEEAEASMLAFSKAFFAFHRAKRRTTKRKNAARSRCGYKRRFK